ncbi:MAG: sulfite exporter TauE/SafE family protein [Alphaproteobacteria bacterium]|nr:sulfite exporter TauE/SafE family protein [Alphaproteobacteria bacterium]
MLESVNLEILLAACMFVGAVLYSSVGHGGASAYLALMVLFGLAPGVMRPTALALNILVASLGSFRYIGAKMFRLRTLWPFLIGSLPFAFLGGTVQLPGVYYKPLVGVVLLVSAARLIRVSGTTAVERKLDPPIWLAIMVGAFIGLLSGLTGTGGGIFLSPILMFFAWSSVREASGVAALFILCNSIAGLAGNFSVVQALPTELPLYAGAVLAGGLIGTTAGISFSPAIIQRTLAVVLTVAGAKLIGVY